MISFNSNLSRVKESATLAINQKARVFRKSGKKVYHFGFGESPFPVHPLIQESLSQHRGKKEYLPGLGLPELREKIISFYKRRYGVFHAFAAVGPGSKELIYQVMYLLKGEVIIPTPSWVSYDPQAMLLGKNVTFLPTDYDKYYKINPEKLDEITYSKNQKILILNSPSNPTGQVYNEEELSQLAQVCEKNNIFVISDEIYSLVNFDSQPCVSISKFIPKRCVVTSGLSKSFSAGGYRLGFLLCSSQELIDKLSVMISETFSCVSSPIQYAAVRAYEDDQEVMDYVDDCTRIHALVVNYAAKRFQDMGLHCHEAEGGFYVFPDFRPYQKKLATKNIVTSKELCSHLIDRLGLFFLPGEDFGYPGEGLAVRAAMVDYDGDKVYQEFKKNPNFTKNFSQSPLLSNVIIGLDLLQGYLEEL